MSEIQAPFRYSGGYLGLLLPEDMFVKLPPTIRVGSGTLLKKDEFHVTIANIPVLSKPFNDANDAERRFLGVFDAHKDRLSWRGFVNEFRHAVTPNRSTLIVRCQLFGLRELFSAFEKEFGVAFESQPTHVTLYTLQPNKGIGIHSEGQMRGYAKMEFPELFATLSA